MVYLHASVKMYDVIGNILDDGGTPSYENVLKVMNAPKGSDGESSSENQEEKVLC